MSEYTSKVTKKVIRKLCMNMNKMLRRLRHLIMTNVNILCAAKKSKQRLLQQIFKIRQIVPLHHLKALHYTGQGSHTISRLID